MSAPDRISTWYGDPASPARDGERVDGTLFDTQAGPVAPGGAHAAPAAPSGGTIREIDYGSVVDSPDFRELRSRTLRFTVPATLLFLGNYLLFVLLSAYAPGTMGTPAFGLVNIGMLLGMFQFVTTVTIVVAYGRFARRHLDPLADHLRDEVEGP